MALYRVTLTLLSALGSAMHSGTLFGQLCWARREAQGEAALEAWLADEERLWTLSDGLPSGHLPRPVLRPVPQSEDPEKADRRKAEKKKAYVTREGFLKIRKNLSEDALVPHLRAVAERRHRLAHNSIDRRTGSTPEEGGLYFLDEDWSYADTDGAARDIYVAAPAGEAKAIESLLAAVGDTGFGRDASLGRGRWRLESVAEDGELAAQAGGRRMSLSHGSARDLVDLRCRLAAHYGKAGPLVAVSDGISPFKKPLLLTRPGATFTASRDERAGELLRNVHPDRPEIVHNAFHVTVAFTEAGT